MNPKYSQSAAASGLVMSAIHALSVYVSLGDKALELLSAGDFDGAESVLSRRKAVLHNFRVLDVRAKRLGYMDCESDHVERLGQAAMAIDAALNNALLAVHSQLCDEMIDLTGRKKIINYRSGLSNPPVVETGI